MKIDSLMEVLPDSYSGLDRDTVLRAYYFAEEAHKGQKRASGDPYITHCVAVAAILAEMRVPSPVVIAGLLHDTVEDTPITLNDIRREFSDEVATLVDGVTKLTNLPRVSRGDQHDKELREQEAVSMKVLSPSSANTAILESPQRTRQRDMASETLRKTFLAMGDDIRVVLIKLADRLHNMRTLGSMPEAKRKRIAFQTLDIFAPLANRLGLWQIKWELEDLSFRYLEPERYKEIAHNLDIAREDFERQVDGIIKRVQEVLKQSGLRAEISGRPKHIYSIWRKMNEKGRPFEMIRDIRGIRLIVADIPSCYAALGIIHTHWRPLQNEFDDYIAAPKDNFYQSLHTAVIYDDGKPLEVQIRTRDMHENAEYGIAAHWRYKEKGFSDESYERRVNWLRKLMEWRSDVDDAQEFVDSMKTDVFQDRVYVFTPRGDIIDLPSGSTPIDFAYHVHTEIGHRCRGAKVNGKLVPLDYALRYGDQVEILTTKHGGPSHDWLNPNLSFVRTQRARSKIRQWFKQQDREKNLNQGRGMLEREITRLGMEGIDLRLLARSLDCASLDEMYVGIGTGDISIMHVISHLSEMDKIDEQKRQEEGQPGETPRKPSRIPIIGVRGQHIALAKCCNPTPPEQIVGYMTRDNRTTIHRQDCPYILRLKEHERLVKVSWGRAQEAYPVNIVVKAYDRQGLMSDISAILNNEKINLVNINVEVGMNLATIRSTIEVPSIMKLSRILTRIENLPNVITSYRVRNSEEAEKPIAG